MKKILFILDSLSFGGAQKQTVDLINNLNRKKFDIGLLYFNPIHRLQPQVDQTKLFLFGCLERKDKFDIVLLKQLHHHITQHGIDTVFCVNEYPFLYAFLCKKIWKKSYQLITVIHHTIIRPGIWIFLQHELYRRILNNCNTVCFVSSNQMNYWIDKYGINKEISMYIHNGIKASHFVDSFSFDEKARLRHKLGMSIDTFIVGICAVLRPEKKHKDFINSIIEVKKKGIPIKGLIIGDGPERYSIDSYIQKRSLQEDVIVTGFQADVRPYISVCDCMVLASHSVETFSIAALESMAMGKAIVETNIGGASEQVMNGVNGFLYEPGDVDALSDALITIAKPDIAKKMGGKAKEIVHAKFSLSKMINAYEALLTD